MSEKISTRDFILANKEDMTVKEAAEALGVSNANISAICIVLGVKMITAKDQRIKFIKEHPEMSVDEIAKNIKCSPGAVRNMISANKLRQKGGLVDRARILAKIKEFNTKNEKAGEIGEVNLTDKKDHNIDWQVQEHDRKRKERQQYKSQIKSDLTQSGSPYGLADQVHGRKLAN